MSKILVKILISIVICLIVYQQIDILKFSQALTNINHAVLIFAFILFNISRILGALRLHLFINKYASISFINNLKLYYTGMFYNLLLPGGISGDGYKALVYKNTYQVPYKKSIALLLIDRVSGLFMLLLLLVSGLLIDSNNISGAFIVNTLGITNDVYEIILYVGLVLIIILSILFYYTLAKEFVSMKYHAECVSLILQLMQVFSFVLLLYAIGEDISILYICIFLLSSLASILPLSFGGAGVRELVFILALGLLEQDENAGIVVALLFFVLTLFSALLGIFYQKNNT